MGPRYVPRAAHRPWQRDARPGTSHSRTLAVCERLGKTNVVIYGHSWGSAFGVLYAARFPEKVAAYVGSGQIGDWPAAEAISYEFALAEAQRLGHRRAIRKLQSIGPPPYSADAVFTERT